MNLLALEAVCISVTIGTSKMLESAHPHDKQYQREITGDTSDPSPATVNTALVFYFILTLIIISCVLIGFFSWSTPLAPAVLLSHTEM